MSIASYCRRPASTVRPDEGLRSAAERMLKEGTGFLAVTEDERLVGVLTDRDVALHVAARGRDGGAARVEDAMSRAAVAVQIDASVEDTLERMRGSRVRRLPVLEGERVEGVVSADDLLLLLAREIGGLGEVLVAQLPAGASRAFGREAPEGDAPELPAPRLAEHYAGEVVGVAAEATVAEVARQMEAQAVGSVLVLGKGRKAVGLITDRDLALRAVAAGLDPARTAASAIMSTPLVAADPSDPLEEVVARMRTASVRRMPILRRGKPSGMVTFDDLLVTFGRELDRVADCVAGEIRGARLRSAGTRMRRDLEERIEEAAMRLREVGDQTLRTLGREVEQVVDRVAHAVRSRSAQLRSAAPSVADLMRTDVRTCAPENTLAEAARIMWEQDCGCVPVVAADGSGRVVGMITDRDVCMAAYTHGARLADVQVKSAMAHRVFSCHPEESVSAAEAMLRGAQVRRLPVVDADGRLRGVLSLADLAEAAAGVRAPAGAVTAAEVGLVLEAVCRPRAAPART